MTPTAVIVICSAVIGFAIFLQTMAVDSLSNEVKQVRMNMATQADVDALTTKVEKVITEIQALKAAHPELDLSRLEAAVQAADDENPDAEETGEEV